MFLAGVSTRRVREVLRIVVGETVSPQTVTRVVRSLEEEVRRFQRRRLSDCYCYLLLDGIALKVKGATGVKRRLVLCAYGIRKDGRREMISFRQAGSESEAQWEGFLRDMCERGLEGRELELVVTDGNPGLHRGLETVYPYVARQRCWVHKLRNVATKLPKRTQRECLQGARRIYLAETKREAVLWFREWAREWRSGQPKAVRCLEADLEELLSFLSCPRGHWRKVRTTNAIERAFREVRRRTRPMSCFQNTASVDRIIYGVISHLNKSWEVQPLQQFTHLS